MNGDTTFVRLSEAASAPYRPAGRFAWHFARGKLRADPVFRYLVQERMIPEGARILDLGCGQGLLAGLLAEAGGPRIASYRGIEMMVRDVARAHRALGGGCGVELGDIRNIGFGAADVVVILDVLHYLRPSEQDDVLHRARQALQGGGRLLLRVGDAAGGLPFRFSN